MRLIIFMDDPSDKVLLIDNLRQIYQAVKSNARNRPHGLTVIMRDETNHHCTTVKMESDLDAGTTTLHLYDPFDDQKPVASVNLEDVFQIRAYF